MLFSEHSVYAKSEFPHSKKKDLIDVFKSKLPCFYGPECIVCTLLCTMNKPEFPQTQQ